MGKIHFAVCGIGFGHAARAAPIIKAMKDRGWLVSISSYGEGLEYLRRHNLNVCKVPGVSYGVLNEGKVSIKMTIYKSILLPLKMLEQVSYEMSLISRGVDLVISDTRASTIMAAKMLDKPVLTILNQFNIRILYPKYRWIIESLEAASYLLGWIWLKSDKILVADFPPPLTISKYNLVFPESTEAGEKYEYIGPVLGDSIYTLPDEEYLRRKYGIGLDGKPVILFKATGPLYERKVLVYKLIPILMELSREFEVVVTLGGLNIHSQYLEGGLKVYEWVEDPLELIKIADLVITRAGQTTLAKILSIGKPVIMIPIPGHAEQYGNATSVEENNAGIKLEEENLCEDTLRSSINRVLESNYEEKALEYSKVYKLLNPIGSVLEEVDCLLKTNTK